MSLGSSGRIELALAITATSALCGLVALSCSTAGGASRSPDGGEGGGDAGVSEEAGKDADRDARGGGGAPLLTSLSVSGSTPASLLVPPFGPDIFDYYVRCAAGSNALRVSMTASPGAESSLTQPITSARLPSQTVPVKVSENAAIVAVATRGGDTTEYWVRCLPDEFPSLEWQDHRDAGTPEAGYYLLGNLRAAKGGAFAMVLDQNGVPLWYESVPTAKGAFDVGDIVKGAISFTPWTSPSSPYEIHRLDPRRTTYVTVPSQDEHELRVLSNGDFLFIANPLVTGVDLTGLSLPLADGGVEALGPGGNILNCDLSEVDGTGTVVWHWTATDHLDPVEDCTWPEQAVTSQTAPDGGVIVDAFHCNAIDVDPGGENFLVSARAMDSIFYVVKSTGRILWKMGGAAFTKDDALYVPVDDPFYRQHDARFQPGWASTCTGGKGQISLFDDQTDVVGPARAVVYDVRVGLTDGGATEDCGAAPDAAAPPDASPASATLAWKYEGAVTSASMGSFRISADGSRVIGWGLGNEPDLVFTEVDVAKNRLLDFSFTNGDGSYRAIKAPASAFDRSVLRKTAGLH